MISQEKRWINECPTNSVSLLTR